MEKEPGMVFSHTQMVISMKEIFLIARCMEKAFIRIVVAKNIAVIGLKIIKLATASVILLMGANIWAIIKTIKCTVRVFITSKMERLIVGIGLRISELVREF